MKVTGKDRHTKHVNNHQATQYVATIETFEDRHWESILEPVQEFLSESSRQKWSKSISSQVSSDFNMEEHEAEQTYVLISDEE